MSARARSRTGLLTAAVLGGALVSPSPAAAQPAPAEKLARVPFAAKTKFVPTSAQGQRPVKVIVQLARASVGQQQAAAAAAGKPLDAAQRRAARVRVKSGQQGVEQLVARRGGTVLADYQDAYNGLAVAVKEADVAALAAAPDVVAVHRVRTFKRDVVPGVQYVRANQAWQKAPAGVAGLTGDGVKIAIIDTGIDYTHADFAGAGTPEAYEANNPTIVEPGTFPTARVVGGYDFVGDDYAADATDPAKQVPHPDEDPLDCDGHGSHVAGIAAGNGVLSNGAAYAGPYDATTYDNAFLVGPGVAPTAKLYAYKVFGCAGSVENSIVIDALNRALVDGIDVVNLSLGSSFGGPGDPEIDTVNTLSLAGVTVVASAGNSGANVYITGAPAAADRAISVAAIDASGETVPGAHAVFSTGAALDLQNSNAAPLPAGPLPVRVLRDPDGGVSLGCDPAEYTGVTGALVVTRRGVCARAARAVFGQQAGAAAVVMINDSAALPPMEGPITSNPDTGEPFTVTIPFLGAPGTPEATATLVAADGGTVTLTAAQLTNTGYQRLASFTSGGPRTGDSMVKPDVTAPGVAIQSADAGTGNKPATISGTSQAAPFAAGTAALVAQAHPGWSPEQIKAAIVNTADPSLDLDYSIRLAGSGVLQTQRAVDTVGLLYTANGVTSLSFGAEQIRNRYNERIPLQLTNTGANPITYELAGEFVGESRGAVIAVSPSGVTVPAGGTVTVSVHLSLSRAAVAALPPAEASGFGALVDIAGAVVATPLSPGAGIYSLRVPFLVAPRGLSEVTASEPTRATHQGGRVWSTSVEVRNTGVHAGNADVYAWGVFDGRDAQPGYVDVRAAGVQTLPGAALDAPDTDRTVVFAVNMFQAWSSASTTQVEIPLDSDRNGAPDAWLIGVDLGAATTGEFDGRYVALSLDAEFNIVNAWEATAPMNSSTMLLPALASDLGLTTERSEIGYSVLAFDQLSGNGDETSSALYDVFRPALSTGEFVPLEPGAAKTLALDFDRAAVLRTRTKGWLIVTLDDRAGAPQADLVRVPLRGTR